MEENMKLELLNPQEGQFLQKIQWNKDEITKFVQKVVSDYGNLAYTEETANEAKKDRATLNRLKKSIDDRRKLVKKEVMKPYDEFEAEVKQVLAMIDQPINMIDKQLEQYEKNYLREKREKLVEHYRSKFPEIAEKVSDERIIGENPKLMNHTVSLQAAYSLIDARCSQIVQEIETIRGINSEFVDYAIPTYFQTLSLAQAMAQINRMEEIKKQKQIDEQRRAQEEERRKEEEQKNEKADNQKQIDESERPEDCKGHIENPMDTVVGERNFKDGSQENTTGNEARDPFEQRQEEKIYYAKFVCWGTKDQLMALKRYMVENNIRIGKAD